MHKNNILHNITIRINTSPNSRMFFDIQRCYANLRIYHFFCLCHIGLKMFKRKTLKKYFKNW